MILECFGICDYYDDLNEDEIEFGKINSLSLFDYANSPNFTFMGFIYKDIYDFDLEYPQFKINDISQGCVNGIYTLNITGEIYEINNEYIELEEYIPKDIKLNLENNLYIKCDILNYETKLKLICNIMPDIRLINAYLKFNVSKLEIDDENIIIDGLIDYLKAASEVLELNANCSGTIDPEEEKEIELKENKEEEKENENEKEKEKKENEEKKEKEKEKEK